MFTPSKESGRLLNEVLFPFQVYLLSQAEGDLTHSRTESIILEEYLKILFQAAVRFITSSITRVLESESVSDLMMSLETTFLNHLLLYVLSRLYLGEFSYRISDLMNVAIDELALLWGKFLSLCRIEASSLDSVSIPWDPIYSASYGISIQPFPWYLSLFNLIVSVSTCYHYSFRLNNLVEPREDVRFLLESYLFSGGLNESGPHFDSSSAENASLPMSTRRFLCGVFDNEMAEYEILHQWLDQWKPEPAWRRKRQPILVNFELKLFIALVSLCGYGDMVKDIFIQLEGLRFVSLCILENEHVDYPSEIIIAWRYVLRIREFLRHKKQEFQSQHHLSIPRSSSVITTKGSGLQLRQASDHSNSTSLPSSGSLKRLMTFSAMTQSPSFSENTVVIESKSPKLHQTLSFRASAKELSDQYAAEEGEMQYPASFEDFVDILLQKLDLLMNINEPWDLNEDESDESDEIVKKGRERIIQSLIKNNSVMVDERGVIPQTRADLIISCVDKFLVHSTTVSVHHLRDSLKRRTENARNKKRIFDEGLQFMQMISPFPQACRLFLLGVFHEMNEFSTLYEGGYHAGRRKREGSYGIDYLENCEGASHPVMKRLIESLCLFCEYLKNEFDRCVENLHWRLGGAIVWFLATIASPKLPYFAVKLNLLSFLESNILRLNKGYEVTNGYSKELLISPGIFWDCMSQNSISLASSHFHSYLVELHLKKIDPSSITIPGIFPSAVLSLANEMRLAYSILLIQQFSDYFSRSRASPAQNTDTLFNWTLTDVSNFFVRQSLPYLADTQQQFSQFLRFFTRMQHVMRERCESWQPFAPISYRNNDTKINMYTCVKIFDAKNTMQGMIATDMLISAAEGVLSSYLALMLFISKTRASAVLPWEQNGNLIWNMVYFSPRHQKLATMLLQSIIPFTNYIPPVFEPSTSLFYEVPAGTPKADSVRMNPLLQPPLFPQEGTSSMEKREAFVYYLLHLVSHEDCCPAALVGERSSCALCCSFFPFIYNTLCPSSPAFNHPNKSEFFAEVLNTQEKVFVGPCKMHIRPDGHTASFCSLVFAEEIVYLLRLMLRKPQWNQLMISVFQNILDKTLQQLQNESDIRSIEDRDNYGFHVILRSRSPWFCMGTAVLKVLGAITPRMYAGCRIRIHEFLMEGENEISTLIQTAYQSHGTGSIIQYHRSMSESLVLLDKIETPQFINNYVFDVVDRVEPPRDDLNAFQHLLQPIQHIIQHIKLNSELFALPADSMPFFNTADLPLAPSELQNAILLLYCVRCVNHLVIANDSLVSQITPETLQRLIQIAVRPLPCRVSMNALIIRQYFNWFIEYVIDTYPGSCRLLPMELQTETFQPVEDLFEADFGVGKDDLAEEDEDYDKPTIIRNEKRMKMAETLAETTQCSVEAAYRVLLSFNEDYAQSQQFIEKHTPEEREALFDSSLELPTFSQGVSDESVLSDLELGIRRQQVPSSGSERQVTNALLSTILPPFSRLQHLNQSDLKNQSGMIGVVASITSKSVTFSPVAETGVITSFDLASATLSILNSNSGILEEKKFPLESVALHKDRFLYFLGNVKLVRGTVGRICTVLSIKFIRELLICLIYYAKLHQIDVLSAWPIKSDELIQLFKYTYVTYCNNLILKPWKHNHVTLVSCLFRILKENFKQIVWTSSHGNDLLSSLTAGLWTGSSVTLSHPCVPHLHRSYSDLLHSSASSSSVSGPALLEFGRTASSSEYRVVSLHPSKTRVSYYDRVMLPAAAGLRVVFDKRCCLDTDNAFLTFYRDEKHTQVIARFTGGPSNFCSFTVRGSTLRFLYESNIHAQPTWGYAFVVQPFENIQWGGDMEIPISPCFDWNCLALDLVLHISKRLTNPPTEYFQRVFSNLLTYLRTAGLPFKSTIVELLIKMLHLCMPLTKLPDVSGLYKVVMDYCEGIDENTMVPEHLPLLIEFLTSCRLSLQLHQIYESRSVDPKSGNQQILFYNNFIHTESPKTDSLSSKSADESVKNSPSILISPSSCSTICTCVETVYVLATCLFYQSIPPPSFLSFFLSSCNQSVTQASLDQITDCFARFTRRLDLSLVSVLEQHCNASDAMLTFSLLDFTLSEDDKARHYGLNSFSRLDIRLRLFFLQYFNAQLQRIVHLVDLGLPRESGIITLGRILAGLTGYIFAPVKEHVLALTISQTVYHGKDCYPVVELDNRRVFTAMERDALPSRGSDTETQHALSSQCTFAQLFRETRDIPVEVLRAPLDGRERLLAVKLKGEQGLDWGGIYRDTIERCIDDLFSDRIDLFLACPNAREPNSPGEMKYLPNPKYRESSDALAMYSFVGNLIGIALRTKQRMAFELCSAVWKTIVGDVVTIDDVDSVDHAFVSTLRQVNEFTQTDDSEDFQELFVLTFSVLDSAGNEVELMPSGSQVPVTYSNRSKFYQLALESRLTEGKQAAEAIAAGVYALVPQRALSLFTWEQLERAVKGEPEVGTRK